MTTHSVNTGDLGPESRPAANNGSSPYVTMSSIIRPVSSYPVGITTGSDGKPNAIGNNPPSLYPSTPGQNYYRMGSVLPNPGPGYQTPERNSIVIPPDRTAEDLEIENYVVTVRAPPAKVIQNYKINGNNNSAMVGRTPPSINNGVTPNAATKAAHKLTLYRSNSSLDLLDRENYHYIQQRKLLPSTNAVQQLSHGENVTDGAAMSTDGGRFQYYPHRNNNGTGTTGCFTRRKDFGSHGSIDMLSHNNGPPIGLNSSPVKTERSGSMGSSNLLSLVAAHVNRDKRGSFDLQDKSELSLGSSNGSKESKESPRLKVKFKLWDKSSTTSSSSSSTATIAMNTTTDGKGKPESGSGLFRKFRGGGGSTAKGVKGDTFDDNEENVKVVLRHTNGSSSGGLVDEKFRRRVFAHYDCQSVSANITYAAKLRGLLSKRRNTTTGASAASLANSRPVSTPLNNTNGSGGPVSLLSDGGSSISSLDQPQGPDSMGSSQQCSALQDNDNGDGKSNALVLK